METGKILSYGEFNKVMKSEYNLDVFEIDSSMYFLNTDKLTIKILNQANTLDELLASVAYKRAHEMTLSEYFQIEYSVIINQNIKVMPITKMVFDEAKIKIFTSYSEANNWILH